MCVQIGIEEKIIKKELLLKTALITGDRKSIDELLDDSFVFKIRKNILTKEDYLSEERMQLNQIHSLNLYLQTFDEVTSDVVKTTLWVEIKVKFKDKDFEGKCKYTHVWKRFNDDYKLISGTIDENEVKKINT